LTLRKFDVGICTGICNTYLEIPVVLTSSETGTYFLTKTTGSFTNSKEKPFCPSMTPDNMSIGSLLRKYVVMYKSLSPSGIVLENREYIVSEGIDSSLNSLPPSVIYVLS